MFYTVSFAQIKFTYMFCKEHSILNTNQVESWLYLHYLPASIIVTN